MVLFKGKKEKSANQEFVKGITNYETQRYQDALQYFAKSQKTFDEISEKKLARRSEAYVCLSNGYISMFEGNLLAAIRLYGKANVLFSQWGYANEAKGARLIQAQVQRDLAKNRATEGEFIESARLYESAGALFSTVDEPQEAARARARSYFQRAASVKTHSEKAYYLKKAIEEFKTGRENSTMYEGHALYQEAMSLIQAKVNVRDAIELLVRAYEKFKQSNQQTQMEKVEVELAKLKQQIEIRRDEFVT